MVTLLCEHKSVSKHGKRDEGRAGNTQLWCDHMDLGQTGMEQVTDTFGGEAERVKWWFYWC